MRKISIEARVTAAVEATRLEARLTDLPNSAHYAPVWDIVHCCKQRDVDLQRIAAAIDRLLALQPRDPYATAWLRLYCAKVEAAIGFAHGRLTRPAIEAWDSDESKPWDVYCASLRTEQPAGAGQAA